MTSRRSTFNEWDSNDPQFEFRRRTWSAWFQRHGIDPADVTVCPGWVEADDDAHTITYLAPVLDAKGKTLIDATANSIRKAPRVVQLTAPAAPFPEPLP